MSMIKSKKGAAEGTTNRESSRERILRLSVLGLFSAIILLLSFTPLGYLNIGILSITLLVIPVAAGAIMLGPWGGLILGTLFGITSFLQFLRGDALAILLLSANPFLYAVMCIVPRMLVGLLAGLISKWLSRAKSEKINVVARSVVTSLVTPMLNTVLFMGTLMLFFWNSPALMGFLEEVGIIQNGVESRVLPVIITMVGINGIAEIAANLIVGTAVGIALIEICKRMTGKNIL